LTAQPSLEDFEMAVDGVRQSPVQTGTVEMLVRRPAPGAREVLQQARLTVEHGLVGDDWIDRWSGREDKWQRHLDMQIAIMNSRVIDAITGGDRERWPLAGDQLFIDLDISEDNLPPGTRLKAGTAILEVTAEPHLGCRKFKERFGRDAVMFVNSDRGKLLKLRGINTRVVLPGMVTSGGVISKLAPF